MIRLPRLLNHRFAATLLALAAGLPCASTVQAQTDARQIRDAFGTAAVAPGQHWVSTWAVSPQTEESLLGGPVPATPTFGQQTLREIIHTSIGGTRVRVRLSNAFGTGSLLVGTASVGLHGQGAQLVDGSNRALTFGGRPSVTIPPGALVVSDPVDLSVPALGDLAVSLYLPNPTPGSTIHVLGSQTSYLAAGDQTAALDPGATSAWPMYYFLSGVEVTAPASVGAIVCLGDSITDGAYSTLDANHRWPNLLAQRLMKPGTNRQMGVINEGIGGNRLEHTTMGPSLLSRFDSDVVAQAGVTHVILLAGINDIGFGAYYPDEIVSADDIIAAYRQLIVRAHAANLKIIGGTLTPFVGAAIPAYYSDDNEAKREAVNAFIRTSGEFDAVVDFEAAVSDASIPPRLLPQYDSGDHLHPNDAGYQAMASAVKLRVFKSSN